MGERVIRSLKPIDAPQIDPDKMFATAIINTDRVDRQRGVILADGIDLSDYANNPTVLYEHGLSTIQHPIAMSQTPEGELTITRSGYEMQGTSYHATVAKYFPVAYQLFGLIHEGVLRATSVGVVPEKQSKYVDKSGREYTVTEKSSLSEWSWCSIGVNPETLKKSSLAGVDDSWQRACVLQTDSATTVLERGTIGNERLLPTIYKSLRALVPAATATSPGFDFQENEKMALRKLTKEQIAGATPDELTLLHGAVSEFDRSSAAIIKSMYADLQASATEEDDEESDDSNLDKSGDDKEADDKKSEDKETEDTESEEKSAKVNRSLPGAMRLTAMHKAISMIADEFEKQFADVEAMGAKEGATGAIEELRSNILASLEGVYTSQYPDHPGMYESDEEEEDDTDLTTQLKSLLSTNQHSAFRVRGVVGRLDRIAGDKSIPEQHRKSIKTLSKSLYSITESAKQFTPVSIEGMVPREELDAEKEKVDRLADYIERQMKPAS
jgi:hypothetical protein